MRVITTTTKKNPFFSEFLPTLVNVLQISITIQPKNKNTKIMKKKSIQKMVKFNVGKLKKLILTTLH